MIQAPIDFLFLNLTTILIGVMVFLTVNWCWSRPCDLPPGPRSWPLIGSLPSLIFQHGAPYEIFNRFSKKYGPIVNIDLVAGNRVVILHGYDVIREAFHHPGLNGRPSLPVFEKVLQGGIGIVGASGEQSKAHRRIVLNFVRDMGLSKPLFETRITAEAAFMLEAFRRRGNNPCDPSGIVTFAVANVICWTVFGRRLDYADPTLAELVRTSYRNTELMGGASGALLFLPHSHRLAGVVPILKECQDNLRCILDFCEDSLSEHAADFDPCNPRDFVDVIRNEVESGRSPVTRSDLFATAADLFAAGTETVAVTLLWGVLCLAACPEVQRRIRRELDGVVGRDRLPGLSDRPRLPYTQAAILEAQRIGSVIPLGVPHKATEEVTLRGLRIPRGTVILANLWAAGMDERLWPQPLQFRPERFLDESGRKLLPKDELIPFCIGRRTCIGEHLARMKLFIFLTHLLHCFSITSPEGSPPISFQGEGGISRSPKPFKVCLTPRH